MPVPHVTHKVLTTADLVIIGLYFCVVFCDWIVFFAGPLTGVSHL